MTDEITKSEREELRRVVRGDFKALAMEVGVREAELLAEIEVSVATRFRAHEEAISAAVLEIDAIVNEANAKISGALDAVGRQAVGYEIRWQPLRPPRIDWVRQRRDELRRAMIADLNARVVAARAKMARDENDLLHELASGALSSDAAKAFLDRIPKVAALVPQSRLVELEAALDAAPPMPDDGKQPFRRFGLLDVGLDGVERIAYDEDGDEHTYDSGDPDDDL